MKIWRLTLIASMLLTLLIAGCSKHNESYPAQALPVAKVRVQTVEAKKFFATEEVVGTVRPKLRATLEAKVSGRIDKMLVNAGQVVKQGELLAQLDVQEIQAKLDQAKAVREQAANDRARYEALLRENVITRQEYDAVQSRFRVADAGLAEAQTMFNYATITAPFTGVVTRKLADVGDLALPGKPLLEMEAQDKLRLEVDVPEALVSQIKLGDKMSVRISDLSSALEGTVAEISPTADANSRTFRVKLDLPFSAALRVGQFGRASVPVAETSALRVPVTALVQRGQMEIVFVAANNHAQLRLVKTGKHVRDEIEILSGLNAGESIVTDGAVALLDGQPLEVAR
jgi:membrane fusion protein, multidrug efflux system